MGSPLRRAGLAAALFAGAAGCAKLEEQTKPTGSIIGKKTQAIGEFDANAGKNVSDSAVRVTNPVTGPLEAYGPMVEQISKLSIEHNLQIFNAANGRYPKDHKEFMEKIIKKYNIELPVLPGGAQYQYDVENHKLVVVKADAAAGAPAAP